MEVLFRSKEGHLKYLMKNRADLGRIIKSVRRKGIRYRNAVFFDQLLINIY